MLSYCDKCKSKLLLIVWRPLLLLITYIIYVANRNKKLNIFRKLILTKKLFVGKVATDTNFAEISSLT